LPVPVEAGDQRDFGSDFHFGARAHGARAFGGDSLPHLFPKTGDIALSIFQSTELSAIKNSIGPSIWNSQVLPQLRNFQVNTQRINFFEPLSTFRFTVSRTF